MTDPIRPDEGQASPEDVAQAPASPLPDGGPADSVPAAEANIATAEAVAAPVLAAEETVADPALAALVATETATPEPVAAPPVAPVAEPVVAAPAPVPVVASVITPPPAAPPVPVAPAAVPVAAPPPAAPAQPRRSLVSIVRRVVAFLFGLLQALLILRIVLLLLNANQDNNIVAAIINVTQPFVEPFMGIFNIDSVTGQNGSVLDIAAIVALIAWTLIESLILSILGLFGRRRR